MPRFLVISSDPDVQGDAKHTDYQQYTTPGGSDNGSYQNLHAGLVPWRRLGCEGGINAYLFTRERLSLFFVQILHKHPLGLVLGDATPGTGGRGLWVPLEGATGDTFGTIRREERDAVPISLADASYNNGAGHGGRPPDTDLRDRVRALLVEHPDWTQQQIADAAGCGTALVKAIKAGRK